MHVATNLLLNPLPDARGIAPFGPGRAGQLLRAHEQGSVATPFAQGKPVATDSANTIADGVACRIPDPQAFELIRKGVERIVTVSEAQIRDAMVHYFTDTHNVAEGAAPLAALLQERERMRRKKVGLVLSGGNADRAVYLGILQGERTDC